jgi:hypothetical protein
MALRPPGPAQAAFYRSVGGWDDPVGNLASMFLFAALFAIVLVAAFVAERVFGGGKWARLWGGLLGAAACWSSVNFLPWNSEQAGSVTFNWFDLPCAFPLLLSGVAIVLVRRELTRPAPDAFPLCLMVIYALGLLPKIALRAGWSHYGFVLTMPAALMLVHVAVYSLPNRLATKAGSAPCFRGVLIGLVVACALLRTLNWVGIFHFKTHPVVSGPDCFYVDPVPTHDERSGPTLRALAYLQKAMRDDDTLVVFPNGTMLNYLLRKRNPTPYQIFSPFEFEIFGDEVLESDVIRAAPDWIVLVTMDETIFGRGTFGDPQYGARIRRLLDEEYEIADQETAEPHIGPPFSATVFRRRLPRD